MKTFIDLFCGIGGFRIALERRHGLKCVFSSDIDKDCQYVYSLNFGEIPSGDITEIEEKNIPRHDILCAGFPCQPFSIAGAKLGFADNRSNMFFNIIRIAKHHMPKVMFLENVRSLLTLNNGSIFRTIVSIIKNIGYEVHSMVINSSYYNIPQSRSRLYFVCIRNDISNASNFVFPKPTNDKIYLEDIIESNPSESVYPQIKTDIKFNNSYEDNKLCPINIGVIGNGTQGNRIYSIKGHAITITSTGGGYGRSTGIYKTKTGLRRLSIVETKRVMGFDDDFVVSEGRNGYRQLGNAVIPQIIYKLYESLKQTIEV